jgi:hypothetical protein
MARAAAAAAAACRFDGFFFQTVNGTAIARWAMPDRDGKPLFS